MWAVLSALLLLVVRAVLADIRVAPGEVRTDIETTFKTEPTFILEYFAIETFTEDASLLAPGYLFIDPAGRGVATGPQIYLQDGTLVWYGGIKRRHRIQDFHVCDYLGSKSSHLCWSESQVTGGAPNRFPSSKIILDHTYAFASRLQVGAREAQPNLHEFNVVDNGRSYLQPLYPEVHADLRPYGGLEDGVMWDGCFQEVDLETAEPIFEWCALDHYPLWETTIWPQINPNTTDFTTTNVTSSKAGEGTFDIPFDPFHLNAVDKNAEGDYLISCRHSDSILKIAGPNNVHGVEPGTTLWRLGGVGNQFGVEGEQFNFSKQHHVRFRETGPEETVISILDNAWEGQAEPSSNYSSGLIMAVNNVTMKARLLHRYAHPNEELTPSQASMQVMPDHNVFIGWGGLPMLTEFSPDGEVLFHASWSRVAGTIDPEEHSYRAFKAPWVGSPHWKPKMIAYSKSCFTSPESPLMAWVSWNGATEVTHWSFSVSTSSEGPWLPVGIFEKTGFETEAQLLSTSFPSWMAKMHLTHAPWVFVAALDSHGTVLGSQVAETFVPAENVKEHCDAHGCFLPIERYGFPREDSCGEQCRRSLAPQYLALILLFVVLEYLDFSYIAFLRALVYFGQSSTPWYAASSSSSALDSLSPFKAEMSGEHRKSALFTNGSEFTPQPLVSIGATAPPAEPLRWAPGHRDSSVNKSLTP